MDFDDHDEGEEEMDLPVGSSYDTPMENSGRGGGGGGGAKMGGGGESAGTMAVGGSGHRKAYGVGGGRGRYRECLKNHAVGIGGTRWTVAESSWRPGRKGASTRSAAPPAAATATSTGRIPRKVARGRRASWGGGAMEISGYHSQFSPYYRTTAEFLHHHHYAAAAFAGQQHRAAPLALPSTSGGGAQSREEQEDMSNPTMGGGASGGGMAASGSGARKRFRTKFTQEQKDKMLAFAERLGWRIQKHDEAAVQQFCEETCIKRHVLKVWMHNNKNTLGKKP